MDWICRGINWWLCSASRPTTSPCNTTSDDHPPPTISCLSVIRIIVLLPYHGRRLLRRESHHNPISAPRTNPIHTQRICTRKGLQTFKDDQNDDGDDDDARLPPTSAQEQQSRTHDSVVDDGVDGGARMNEWMSPAPILNLIFAEHNHPLIRTHNTMHTLDNWHTTTTRAEDSIETLVVLTGYTRTRINNYFNFPANRRRPQEEGDAVGFGGDSPTI